nr:reverse transcriptase domain-containing protein [Tanacetum cinerariifolium]
MLPVAPPSLDYIPGPKEPQTPPTPQNEDEHKLMFIQPQDPDFMPEPIYPEYVVKLDPEEDPEEYEEDETEDGPVDYPIDGRDDGDDDDDNSYGYDVDDEDEEEEEEDKQLASADSTMVIPIDELTSISLLPEAEVERLLAMPTPSPSPLTSLSPPFPPRKRLCLSTLNSRYRIGESSTRERGVDYRFTNTVETEMRYREAYAAYEAWAQLVGLSQTAHHEIQTLREQVYAHEYQLQTYQSQLQLQKSVHAMIDQALLINSTNVDGSQSSHEDNPRHVQTTRPCFYANFMKYHPLNFKGNEGVIRTLGPEAYAMTWEVLKKKMTNKNFAPMRKGLTTKERLRIHLETTMGINNNPSKSRMSPRSIIWGRERGNHMKDLCQSAQSANVITMARALRSATNATRDGKETPKGNGCFKYEALGHFKRDCPKIKNNNGGDRNAQGWVYAVGNTEKSGNAPMNPDSNVVTGTFLLNNHYASILFDTGADRSFISIAFSSLVNIDPTPLGSSYDIELADGKIVRIDTIIRGFTINFLNHPFNIDLIPIELGSFDVIIGMDWLRRCHVVIVYDEKLVQIPYGNETLTFHGNKSNNERESRLIVISCSKAQRYMAKGCQAFMAQISAKKEEDKPEGK